MAAVGLTFSASAGSGRDPASARWAATFAERRAAEMASPLSAVDQPHGGGFAVGADGGAFQVRGFDYLALTAVRAGRSTHYDNHTFVPGYYHHARVARMLATMEAKGYTTVRVLLNPHSIGNPTGAGLSSGYVADVADFVRTARSDDVRTLITVGELPTSGGYAPPGDPRYGGANADYLDPAAIAARERYLTDLVTSLERHRAPLVDVLWELKGEQNWDNRAAPLDWHTGTVATADGHRYDMAVPAARAAMERDNLLHWTNVLSKTLHELIPGSLVGVGAYAPSVHRPNWTVRPQVLFQRAAANDFVDVHIYPNLGPEAEQIKSFEAGATAKPVIMGEFGATRRSGSVAEASRALVTWQRASCRLAGLSIAGWLLWTWNSAAQTEFWTARSDGGAIARALSPATRPDPCR